MVSGGDGEFTKYLLKKALVIDHFRHVIREITGTIYISSVKAHLNMATGHCTCVEYILMNCIERFSVDVNIRLRILNQIGLV